MTTPTNPNFHAAIDLHNPCAPGTDECSRWINGALNGRANKLRPTEFSTPAYYEGWWWGREWQQAQQVE